MSKSVRHVGLEQSETAVHSGRARTSAERRAALEEELLTAFGAGDAGRVSELRAVLAGVAADGEDGTS